MIRPALMLALLSAGCANCDDANEPADFGGTDAAVDMDEPDLSDLSDTLEIRVEPTTLLDVLRRRGRARRS